MAAACQNVCSCYLSTELQVYVFFWNNVQVADENNDVQLADFVESEFLGEQVTQYFSVHG